MSIHTKMISLAAGSALIFSAGLAAAQQEQQPQGSPEVEVHQEGEAPPGSDVEVEVQVETQPNVDMEMQQQQPMEMEQPPEMQEPPPMAPTAEVEAQATAYPPVPVEEEDECSVIRGGIIDVGEPGCPSLPTRIGLGLTVGGGATGFVDESARDITDVGGGWDARLTIGTRSIIAGEVGYVGSAQNITALGLDTDAVLLGNGLEALARLNILTGIVQPYVIGGAGFMNYQLVNEDFNTSAIQNSDFMPSFPVGGGLGFRYEGLLVDARGIFRPVLDDELFGTEAGDMHSWDAKLTAGVEF